jgi:hypothetical protein
MKLHTHTQARARAHAHIMTVYEYIHIWLYGTELVMLKNISIFLSLSRRKLLEGVSASVPQH